MARQARVGLSVWDRLVLLVAWAVTCGLVYVLGFYVGKGMQEQRAGVDDRAVRLPVTGAPPAAGQRPSNESDLTFYDTLASGQRSGAGTEPAPARSATPSSTLAPARPAAPPSTLVPSPPSTIPAPRPAPPTTMGPPRPAPPSTLAAPRVPPAAAVSEPARVVPSPAPSVGGWTVVAELTRSRDEAESLQRRLRGRGYDATVVRVARDGDTWYRVRVGRFSTNAQAEEVRQRLREHEGVTHVFVASE